MRINTNTTALQTYRNLLRNDRGVQSAMGKLSSGLRLNSVKDDPASMAISLQMRNQINGLNMAERNNMDGISLIQTADGALNEVHDMLQRMRELSIQGATDSYEPTDRDKLQGEVDQLNDEINLIANRTEFNRMKILNGSASTISSFGVVSAGKVVRNSKDTDMGSYSFDIDQLGSKATTAFNPTLNMNHPHGQEGKFYLNNELIQIEKSDTGKDILRKIEVVSQRVGIQIEQVGGVYTSLTTKEFGSQGIIDIQGDNHILQDLGLQKGLVLGTDSIISNLHLVNEQGLPNTSFNNKASYTAKGNRIQIHNGSGSEIVLDINEKRAIIGNFTFELQRGGLQIQVGPNKDMSTYIELQDMSAYGLEIDQVNLLTKDNCQQAIIAYDKAINLVSEIRSHLGAYQNRFEYASTSLTSSSEQASQALSRIMDTDMALEMTRLAKFNVLYQAGISIMAQANMRPQQLLQLMD